MASSASALPWLWVIEALASFKQVDASILKELVKRTPEITGDLGKDAREMVYFRVLDTLASRQVRSNGIISPVPVSENNIDQSESCENVVVRILHERTDEAEMLKSEEFQHFITQKRTSLPKCTLQKLKDAILEGKPPALASFKEKSGLSTSNKARVGTSTNDFVFTEAIGLSDGQTVGGGHLTSPNAEKLSDISQKDHGNRNLTPSKRDTSYLENENQNQAFRTHVDHPSLDHGSDTHLQITKKPKHCAFVTGLVVGHEPLSAVRDEQREALVDELEFDVPVKEAKDDPRIGAEIGTSKAAPPNGARDNICGKPNPNSDKLQRKESNSGQECSSDSDGYHEESLDTHLQISKKPKHSVPVTGSVVRHEPLSAVRDERQEALVDELELDLLNKEAMDDPRSCAEIGMSKAAPPNGARENICCKPNPNSEKSHRRESNTGQECSSDSDGYHEERLDVSTKKCNFLSSHCTFTQDSLATADCTELSLCMKCEKGGDLLVCNGAVCPIVVHEGCLGAAPSFDSSGKFLCPFCSYSHAISEYLKFKKQASMVRKDLAVFIGSENGPRPKKRPKKSLRPEQGQHRQDDNVSKNNPKLQNHVNMKQAEPSASNSNPPLNVKGGLGVDGIVFPSKESNREGGKIDHPVMDLERQKMENGHRPKQIAKKSIRTEHQNHVNHAINFGNKENIGGMQQSEPSTSNDNPPVRVESAVVDDGSTFASKESNRGGGKIGSENHSAMASKRQQIVARDSQNPCNNSSPCREREIVLKTKKHASEQAARGPNADVAANSEEKDGFRTYDYIMRPRKQEMHYTYPAMPQLRRNKVPWTPEEEEVLEEGVKKFSGTLDRAMRWKQILEYGSRVFQKGRTAIDLKDKWRNICKRHSNL